jgi:hypothetical protein
MQRIVGFALLFELYRKNEHSNPFLPFFLDSADSAEDACEKNFLRNVLVSTPSNQTFLKVTIEKKKNRSLSLSLSISNLYLHLFHIFATKKKKKKGEKDIYNL